MDGLGLCIHLGHSGSRCRLPGRSETLTIIHTNGFHRVPIIFCGCSPDQSALMDRNQLLRLRLFPASPELPRTAVTFEVLDLFSQLSTQGKLSAYDFHLCLLHVTDNLELAGWPVSKRFKSLAKVRTTNTRLEALRGAVAHCPLVQTSHDVEAGWTWSRPRRSRIYEPRRVGA